ncbi:hypothetical protein WH87_07290 [Devosia epidermidihirudinis]|uniref:DUF559 domain-containing protein n=1 Tax=Devosia epidermidihirudinis TaxID=1293439 RepID=A0A0F5QCK2_9HYPH|nr:endonuclease domain-containing protein [Devosia epidermidihirudinis]KKC38722.1 hypothetical protein WH87_07290 [Devosia epidermidihirudinis]
MGQRTELARKLRREPTPAELRFWEILYTFRQSGWHFRRQVPVGPYIVDFACKRAKLAFEIDGDSHYSDAGLAADAVRTAYIEERGYRVVRFTNLDVLGNPEGVYLLVADALKSAPPNLPLKRGRNRLDER